MLAVVSGRSCSRTDAAMSSAAFDVHKNNEKSANHVQVRLLRPVSIQQRVLKDLLLPRRGGRSDKQRAPAECGRQGSPRWQERSHRSVDSAIARRAPAR